MNIRVEKRENPYVQIDKTPINDSDLSPQSMGVLFYILSKPNNWKAHKSEIVKRFSNTAHITVTANAIDNCFIELRKAGYVRIIPTRGQNGQVNGSEYVFSETPNKPTDMATSTDVGESTEMPRCSEVGKSLTVGNLPSYNNESFKLIKNDKKKKESKEKLTFSENQKTGTVQTTTPTHVLNTKTENSESNQIPPTLVQTKVNNGFRIIQTREELIKVTEGVIKENAETFKMLYKRKGFKLENATDYAIEFTTQFFKDAEKCSLSDAKIKDKLFGWSYIFGKVNAEIATATKAENLNVPFAERKAKEQAAQQEVKKQEQSNAPLTKFQQLINERNRIAYEKSKA